MATHQEFVEEQENLNSIERKIEDHVDIKTSELKSIQHEIHDFFAVDLTDVDRKQELRYAEARAIEDIHLWNSYRDSPYFGHLDLTVDDDETNTFLIGNTGIGEGTKNYVIDWRNPVGQLYYNKHSVLYRVEDHEYALRLRRAVDIKHAKLIDVFTDFESETSLDGEIIDPFLISVLKDKRRNYKLTDIIRTIQEKQNEIISRPLDESFILQGCAGSGKTMILLHRLSYLAYNNPNMGFGRVFVLTPSTSFNLQVDELSKQLGLDQIKRYTVEEFYCYLISALARSAGTADGDFKKIWKKLEPSQRLVSEKLLNPALLTRLYSEDFYDEVIEEFNSVSDYAVQGLKKLGIIALLRKYHYNLNERSAMDLAAYKVYSEAIGAILTKHETAAKEIVEKQNEADIARINADDARIAHETARESIVIEEKALLSRCDVMLKEIASDIDDTGRLEDSLATSLADKMHEKEIAVSERDTIEKTLKSISDNKSRLLSIDYLRQSEDEVAKIVRKECADDIAKVSDLSEQMDKIPIYNFGRRTKTRNELESARQGLVTRAGMLIDQYREEITARLNEIQLALIEKDQTIEEIAQKLGEARETQKRNVFRRNSILRCKNALTNIDFPDLQKVLKPDEMDYLRETVGLYQIAYLNYSTTKNRAHGLENVVERINNDILKIRADLLPEQDFEAFKKAAEIVQEFSFDKQFDSFVQKIKKVYKEYGEEYSRNNGYRHMLYLKLLFCSMCYRSAAKPDLYLNIDEAQDLAIAEYRLLRALVSDKAVFNLYGDVNQSIYEYKGIEDWDQISSVIPHALYVLNENYRNTLEITRYCNQVFGAEVTPVGLSGASVVETSFEEACSKAFELEKKDPNRRIAVIYKRGVWGVQEELDYCKKQRGISDTRIQVLAVEESKGLEFDAVIVLTNEMNENEKYISYTRALDNLIISESDQVIFDKEYWLAEAEGEDLLKANQDLPVEPKDVDLLLEGKQFINAFFNGNTLIIDAFTDLSYYAIKNDSVIQLRVAPTYIGMAHANERCRFYVSRPDSKGNYRIKYVSAEAEPFIPENIEHYKKAFDDCVDYIASHSIRLKEK